MPRAIRASFLLVELFPLDLAVDSLLRQLFIAYSSSVWNYSLTASGPLLTSQGNKLFERQTNIKAIAADSLSRLFFTQSEKANMGIFFLKRH